jgi:archaetidylinositol phosphate synthase
MVPLSLGQLADAAHEVEGVAEARELERALERLVHLGPPIRNGHLPSIYDRGRVGAGSTESAAPAFRVSAKNRPAPELVVAVLFRPLAHRLALALAPTRIPPPAVVLAAAATGVAASLALAQAALVAAALLLQLKTLLDNTDGGLARLTGRVTLVGRYLDTEADTALNLFLFAVLGTTTGLPWLALAAFCALTIVLSVNFNLVELYRQARGEEIEAPPRSGTRVERALERAYGVFFAPQDRLIRTFSARRLERLLRGVEDARQRRSATLLYHDRLTLVVLANLGLSTQLAVLGICLVADLPELYLALVLASLALLPVLQIRRELLVRASRRRAA